MLSVSLAAVGWSPAGLLGQHLESAPRQAIRVTCQATEVATDFEAKKALTIEGIRREYDSFFQPMCGSRSERARACFGPARRS